MKKISLLIVNDHPVVREGLVKVLSQFEELSIVEAISSNYHLHQKLEEKKPDVLLLDTKSHVPLQQMLAECRVVRPYQHIVLCSPSVGLDEKRLVERFQVDGVISYLEDGPMLLSSLLAMAGGQRVINIDQGLKEEVDRHRVDLNEKLDHPLSPREVDVLCCVAQAMTAKEIASDLRISVKTVDRHKANIMNKLNMRSQIELARFAIRHGFVEA